MTRGLTDLNKGNRNWNGVNQPGGRRKGNRMMRVKEYRGETF